MVEQSDPLSNFGSQIIFKILGTVTIRPRSVISDLVMGIWTDLPLVLFANSGVTVRSVGMAERVLRLCKTRLSPSISAA